MNIINEPIWIKVTPRGKSTTAFINTNNVQMIESDGTGSIIVLLGNDHVYVNESIDDISNHICKFNRSIGFTNTTLHS